MSYKPQDFQGEIAIGAKIWSGYPQAKAELTLLSTAVKAALTTHDRTIDAPLGILLNGNSYFQRDINLIINKGWGGNLTAAQMGAAMDAVVATLP